MSAAWLRFTRHATRWLSFLGRLQPAITAPQPYAEQVTRFADYMRQERGLSPRTIEIAAGRFVSSWLSSARPVCGSTR